MEEIKVISKNSNDSGFDQRRFNDDGIVGKLIGDRYSIEEQIGSGGQAKLFRGRDHQEQRTVAIKVFDFRAVSDWKEMELLKREVDGLKSLHIEGIPEYIDFIESAPYSFLVESYIPAKSLESFLEDGVRFDETQVDGILRACLKILSGLHHQTTPIVHRDIKPGNILWDPDTGKVWIVDLGSITAFRFKGTASTVAGTAGYAAPEQLMGKASPVSDIYGLGMTVIHLLTGIAPWEMEMDGLTIQYKEHLPKQLSRKMQQILGAMVEVEPKHRLDSADLVLELLDSIPEAGLPMPGDESLAGESGSSMTVEDKAAQGDLAETAETALDVQNMKPTSESIKWLLKTVYPKIKDEIGLDILKECAPYMTGCDKFMVEKFSVENKYKLLELCYLNNRGAYMSLDEIIYMARKIMTDSKYFDDYRKALDDFFANGHSCELDSIIKHEITSMKLVPRILKGKPTRKAVIYWADRFEGGSARSRRNIIWKLNNETSRSASQIAVAMNMADLSYCENESDRITKACDELLHNPDKIAILVALFDDLEISCGISDIIDWNKVFRVILFIAGVAAVVALVCWLIYWIVSNILIVLLVLLALAIVVPIAISIFGPIGIFFGFIWNTLKILTGLDEDD